MQPPSFLEREEPHEALCRHFNVVYRPAPGPPVPSSHRPLASAPALPATFDLPVLRDAHMPTHLLALLQTNPDGCTSPPLMAPIHADLYNRCFGIEIIPAPPPGTVAPVPHPSPSGQSVTLPVVPVPVPHAPSVPLLLLFGLGLERHTNLLAWRLLPPTVVEEFPNAAAMAQVMARSLPEDEFARRFRYNQGLWQNVLALGLRDQAILGIIQTAWNVTAEARKMRNRMSRG